MKQKPFSNEEISEFCRNLSTLLHAGLGTADALSLMAEDTPAGAVRTLLDGLSARMDEGTTLPAAVRESGVFPDYVCRLLEIGERTGRTEETLSSLAESYDSQSRLSRELRSALLYPAILLVVLVAVLVVLLVYVLPIFREVYAQLGAELTGAAGFLLGTGKALGAAMPVLCAVLAVVTVFLIAFAVSDRFRDRLLTAWTRRSKAGGIPWQIALSRFAQALSMGISSGLPLEETVSLSSLLLEDMGEAHTRCLRCEEMLSGGTNLSKALSETGLLPASEGRLLSAALRSGAGDTAIRQIAQRLTESSEDAIHERVSRVEPVLVIVGSVLVGLILLCVMLPLLHIMAAIG